MTDIHNLFHENDAPDAPTDGWAENVRARRGRKRVAAGVAAGVLAVGLAVPVGMALLNQGGAPSVAEPVAALPSEQLSSANEGEPPAEPLPVEAGSSAAVTPSEPELGGAPICKEAAKIVNARHDGAGQTPLTEGATTAWLCGDSMSVGALDPLTVGVDEAIKLVLDQPEAPADQPCTMEYRLAYTVVFEYADGAIVPVTGELHGCRTLNDGVTSRSGGEELFEKVTGLWTAQRADSDFQAPLPEGCSAEFGSVLPIDLTQVAAVQTCELEGETWTSNVPDGNAELAEAVAQSLQGDLGDPGDTWAGTNLRLELFDRWGSKVSLEAVEGGGFISTGADGTMKLWTPSPELAASLGLPAN